MKEDLICGVAILLYLVLLYLLTTAFIKTGRAVERYKMKKKTDKIKVGQRYELKYFLCCLGMKKISFNSFGKMFLHFTN